MKYQLRAMRTASRTHLFPCKVVKCASLLVNGQKYCNFLTVHRLGQAQLFLVRTTVILSSRFSRLVELNYD